MNIFRFAGDMTHLFSVLVLLLKIYATKSCSGISLKTQELYVVVFVARYLDLFTNFVSLYNTVMKLVFIGSSILIVWWMRAHPLVRRSYDKELDTFRHYFLIAGCFALALLFNESFTFGEVFWTFSIYLEAVAILPQLVLLQRSGNVDNLTGQYVFFLGYGFLEDILKEVCIQFETTSASKNYLGVVNVQFPSFHLVVSHRVDSLSPKSVKAVEQVGKMYKKWLVSQNLHNSTHSALLWPYPTEKSSGLVSMLDVTTLWYPPDVMLG